ncbi:hypothetical protein L6Q82_37955, partial [Burkholderia cenocepacia]|uniref:hypothetical protein n=1 Tax=Burkholderia cenocepacia TaxID=95486 RepID=UPI001F31FB7C
MRATFQQSYPHALWIAEKPSQNPAISVESCERTFSCHSVSGRRTGRRQSSLNEPKNWSSCSCASGPSAITTAWYA